MSCIIEHKQRVLREKTMTIVWREEIELAIFNVRYDKYGDETFDENENCL